jgi:hypothetical protein
MPINIVFFYFIILEHCIDHVVPERHVAGEAKLACSSSTV